MTFDSSKPLKKIGSTPVPQYWNDEIGDWEVVQGANGAYRTGSTVEVSEEPFSASGNLEKEFTTEMSGFVISNDGNADLTFTINGKTRTVKAGEVYEGRFKPFTTVTVNSTVPWRAEALQAIGAAVVSQPPSDTTAPDNVTNLIASNVAETSLTLTWIASASTDTTGYEVWRGSSLITTVTGTTYNATGLTASTQYTFTIKAKDAANNIASGTQITVTTAAAPADTTPPNNVTNVTATNVTHNSLTVGWSVSSSSDVASYEVYQGSTLLGTVTGTTYNVTGLTASTSYTFTVKAKDSSNNVASGASVTISTEAQPAADTTAPDPVTNLTAGTVTSSSISVNWTLSASGDVANYEVAHSTDGTNFTVASAVVNASSTTYTVTGLSAGTAYTVRVVAIDGAGNRSTDVTVQATTTTSAYSGYVTDGLTLYAENPANASIIPDADALFVGTGNWSLCMTVRCALSDVVSGLLLLSKAVAPIPSGFDNCTFRIIRTNDGRFKGQFYITNASSVKSMVEVYSSTGTDITSNFHLTFVRNGTKISMQVNNLPSEKAEVTLGTDTINSSTVNMVVGQSGKDVEVRNVAYYSRALTSGEITQNYNALK